jgi:hypothetical protein
MSQPTALYQLVEARLGRSLVEYVAERRATTSWRAMAADLTETAGITVTYETLRGWFADRVQTTIVIADAPTAGAA